MKPQMLQESSTHESQTIEAPQKELQDESVEEAQSAEPTETGSDFRVILYNDDYHDLDEVVLQLIKATGYQIEQCLEITLEVDHKGRAICYRGGREECHRVTRVLREIRLQCEVDCD